MADVYADVVATVAQGALNLDCLPFGDGRPALSGAGTLSGVVAGGP